MILLTLLTLEGRPMEIAKIIADIIDRECKDDSTEDISEALNGLLGIASLKQASGELNETLRS